MIACCLHSLIHSLILDFSLLVIILQKSRSVSTLGMPMDRVSGGPVGIFCVGNIFPIDISVGKFTDVRQLSTRVLSSVIFVAIFIIFCSVIHICVQFYSKS